MGVWGGEEKYGCGWYERVEETNFVFFGVVVAFGVADEVDGAWSHWGFGSGGRPREGSEDGNLV